MPSQLHKVLLLLFRNRPPLAAELLRDALHVPLPEYSDARIDSADLSDVQPAEYRADLVVLLSNGEPVLGIVVEVQLSVDERKQFVWPAYAVNLRARLKCPVCLLVVAANEAVARWAARTIELGGSNRFHVQVLSLSGVPEVTDVERARADPELAVLAAISHGRDADAAKALQIARAAYLASAGLDADRSRLYLDLVTLSLSKAARRELQSMKPARREYRNDYAGIKARLAAEIRGEFVGRLLERRFGPLTEDVWTQIDNASDDEIDAIEERLLSAQTLQEALSPLR